MSDLPKAVQAQLDQAEALQAQLNTPATPEGNPAMVETPAETSLQPVEPVVQPTQVTNSVPDDTWEQRFRIMEGKFKAEVPRLHEQNRELSERLDQAILALEAKTAEPPVEKSKLVTDADVEKFGDDLVDMVRRAAREEFDTLAAKFAEQMDKRIGAVDQKVAVTEQRVVKTEKDKFWDAVTAQDAAPDFDVVNEDPRWFAFLDVRVPGSRLTRRALAEAAVKNLDAEALIEQVKAFKETIAAPVAPVPPTPPAKPKQSLSAQVAPDSSNASAPVVETGRIWSGQEYAQALDHRNMQRISREEYEANVAEAEQALAEGRVRF